MRQYFIPMILYVFTIPIIEYFFKDIYLVYIVRLILVSAVMLYFWKSYKFKLKFDYLSIFIGVIIFIIWVGIAKYVIIGTIASEQFIPTNTYIIIVRLLGLLIIAPILEEFFTRFFLMRMAINEKWQKVKIGMFTWSSFIITVLFFGFSHNAWIAGLITGILLNILIYIKKDINSCVVAHFVANFLLVIFILYTQSWYLW